MTNEPALRTDSKPAPGVRGWLVVATLFVTLGLVWSTCYGTMGVFITPLVVHFGWSRARASSLTSILAASSGLSVPVVGWLLDRIDARQVIVTGVAMCAVGCLVASRAHWYGPMAAAYLALGLGLGASTMLPAALVVANWFEQGRGLAMGIAMSGSSVGSMILTPVVSETIEKHGWRTGYVVQGLPMLLVAIPLLLVFVRGRPPHKRAAPGDLAALAPPDGLEIRAAMGTRSLWLLVVVQFCFGFVVAGSVLHFIPYLRVLGYRPRAAAFAMSVVFAFNSLGKLVMGWLADRTSGRFALTVNFLMSLAGIAMLFGAARVWVLAIALPFYGLPLGAPQLLVPLTTVESLGLRRFGSISGITGFCNTVGRASGSVAAGAIFDLTGGYGGVLRLFIALSALGALATCACLPLAAEQARLEERRRAIA